MGNLRIGAVRKEITPSVGIDLSGYIRRFGSSEGIHDPLWANFLWVENGIDHVLLISLDVLNISEEFSLRAKAGISEELNIEKNSILIASTHTHSAPGIHLFRSGVRRDKTWEEKVLHTLITGSKEALKRIKKAFLGIGTSQVTLGKNRRKEEGTTDPCFSLACFLDERDIPMAILANYGCHPVVLDEENLLVSADYIGYFRHHLNNLFSSNITTLFFTGATGNVDPIERGSFAAADKLGKKLAREAVNLIKNVKLKSSISIKTEKETLRIPYGWIPSSQEAEKVYEDSLSLYEEAKKKGNREDIKIKKAFLLWAEDVRKKALDNQLPSYLNCELQCIKLENAVFLAFPFELFSSISLLLRDKSSIENLFMLGYANGYYGYLPDEASFFEGGYEIEEAFKYWGLLPLSSQAGSLFLERALSLIEKVRSEE